MATGKNRLGAALAVGLLFAPVLSGSQGSAAPVTAEDRAGIEALLGRYLIALGSCDAQMYASLFVTPDGFFAAGARGRVDTRHRLTEMIKSYDCNYVNGVAPPHAPTPTPPYKLVVEPAPGGAVGIAYLNGARYEDEYFKTARGWLFKSRTVVTNAEHAANLTRADFEAIQQLALRNGGPYVDLYEKRPDGTSRFKSAGVAISVSPEGVTGKAYLEDGGHYEDVYVKENQGWRFQSRTYVAADATPATTVSAQTPRTEIVGAAGVVSPIVVDLDRSLAFYQGILGLKSDAILQASAKETPPPAILRLEGTPDGRTRWAHVTFPGTTWWAEPLEFGDVDRQPTQPRLQDAGAR